MKLLVLLLLPVLAHAQAPARDDFGRLKRNPKIIRLFRATVPCPATGRTSGICAGYVVDHKIALACAKTEAERLALDDLPNLQWQTRADAKAKDKVERKQCGKAD
jgi:hypothetical protein